MSSLPHMALSLRQPVAYIAGALHGDAFLTTPTKVNPVGRFGLRVADRDFADAVAACAALLLGTVKRHRYPMPQPKLDGRGYWVVSTTNTKSVFSHAKRVEPVTPDEMAAWLRGLFDSEGNAQCAAKPSTSPNSWDRRVSFYSTEPTTLDRAARMLEALELPTRRTFQKASATHKGTRPVEELAVRCSRDNFARFATVVGSSIARKQRTIDRMLGTYVVDIAAHCRAAQALGVAARKARREAGGVY